jgi:uncharacterized protein DUF2786
MNDIARRDQVSAPAQGSFTQPQGAIPMADINSILEKIRKLRALAGNNNCEAEVKAALAAADKLIQAHRISESELEASGNKSSNDPLVRKSVCVVGKRSSWKEKILHGLCGNYGACFYMQTDRGDHSVSYMVCARTSDADIIEYMFASLVEDGMRLSKSSNPITAVGKATSATEILDLIKAGNYEALTRDPRDAVSWAKSYLEGFGSGVQSQFDSMHRAQLAAAAGSTAMVLLDNRGKEARAFMTKGVRMRSAGSLGGANSDRNARSAGYSAGLKANVNRGLGGGGGSRGSLGQ